MNRLDPHHGAPGRATGSPATAESRFAARIRQALDESTASLEPPTVERLALARKAALRMQRMPGRARMQGRELAMAGASSSGSGGSSRGGFARGGLVFSVIVLVAACLAGLYDVEQDRRIEDLADVDSAVLTDDLPISAYADHGFNAFLKQNP